MSEEPPVRTVVKDKDDELWRREPFGWVIEIRPGKWDSGPGAGLSWSNLIRHYGPIMIEQES